MLFMIILHGFSALILHIWLLAPQHMAVLQRDSSELRCRCSADHGPTAAACAQQSPTAMHAIVSTVRLTVSPELFLHTVI